MYEMYGAFKQLLIQKADTEVLLRVIRKARENLVVGKKEMV